MSKSENDKLTLNAGDIRWLTGDSIVFFVSGSGNTDTLRREVYEECFPADRVTGKIKKDAPFQIARCDVIRHEDMRIVVTMCMERIDTKRVDTYLKFEVINDKWGENYRDIRFINRQLESVPVVINSTNYGECIVIDKWDSDNLPYYMRKKGHNIDKAVWSKKYGLLYYKFEDGEEFTRIPD